MATPDFSIPIWLSGNDLCLELPPTEGRAKSHTIRIPLEKCGLLHDKRWDPDGSCLVESTSISQKNRGWGILLSILQERVLDREPTVSKPSAPTQYDVDQMLKSMKATVKKAEKREFDNSITLEDLGL